MRETVCGGPARLLAVGAMLFLAPSCEACDNEKLAEYPSPDGKMKVVVFERNCGATTDFSTQASVLAVEKDVPRGGGNLFVADTNHGSAPSGPGGGPEVRVRWIDGRTVEVAHDAGARVFKSEPAVGQVRATFVTFR